MEVFEYKKNNSSKFIIIILLIIVFIAGYALATYFPFINNDVEVVEEVVETDEPYEVEESEPFDSEVKSNDATDAYFEDALFVGDSRMEGLVTNASIENLNAITSIGMTVQTAVEDELIRDGDEKITVLQKLEQEEFSKIYLMLGTNELGWAYPEIFIEKYSELIDEIKISKPNAIIYILSIMPVNEKLIENSEYKNNAHISEVNLLLKDMCDNKGIYFLNIYDLVYDEEMGLNLEASTDGLHLGPTYCNKVFDYLKDHYVEVK